MEYYVRYGLVLTMENFSEHSTHGFRSIHPSLPDNGA